MRAKEESAAIAEAYNTDMLSEARTTRARAHAHALLEERALKVGEGGRMHPLPHVYGLLVVCVVGHSKSIIEVVVRPTSVVC